MSNVRKFKSGDVVVLKSGGPWMTVRSRIDESQVYCEWFGEDDLSKTHYSNFDDACLYSEEEGRARIEECEGSEDDDGTDDDEEDQ